MFYDQNTLYFASIRKIAAGFGSIFTNVVINRYADNAGQGVKNETIRVPFFYGPTQKYLKMLNEQRRYDPNKPRIRKSVPRIGYELTGMEYDATRKTQSTLHLLKQSSIVDSNGYNEFLKQLSPVPYIFNFDVHCVTKNIDDGLQIIEQIVPNFNPSYNITIKEIPELGIIRDIPVIFKGISLSDDYEGNFEEDRVLTHTLSFSVLGYLYPNIRMTDTIRKVLTSIYNDPSFVPESKETLIDVSVDPIDAPIDNYTTKQLYIKEINLIAMVILYNEWYIY